MNRCVLTALLALLLAVSMVQTAPAISSRKLAKIYAMPTVTSGKAVGMGVIILRKDKEPRIFTYGDAVVPSGNLEGQPFSEDSLFEIGSVTKVFTTNLFGQYVDEGKIGFEDRLAGFETQLGNLKPKMSRVTLKELGDFTGGIIDIPGVCQKEPDPTCLPSPRPTIEKYTAQDFAAYFANTVPLNYQPTKAVPKKPPVKTNLPAPYFYSDFGLGLLGLLIASDGGPLTNDDFWGWYQQVTAKLLDPLGMEDTYLYVSTDKLDQRAFGYDQALGEVVIENGSVSEIKLLAAGASYKSRPKVRIVGGGGSGAKARAVLDGEEVSSIVIKSGGSGYVEPATIELKHGRSSTAADVRPVIRHGKIVGAMINGGGAGYKRAPDVIISGGRNGGTNASATAYMSGGEIVYVGIDDPGSGYVDPVHVVVWPGEGVTNPVPVWAPAGALKTTLSDMAKFAESAMRHRFGHANSEIDKAFRFAQKSYACTGPDPSLENCDPLAERSGLAWAIQPGDPATGRPEIVSKNGALAGFNTQVSLAPGMKLGVVVFANSLGRWIASEKATAIAPTVANNILNALIHDELHP